MDEGQVTPLRVEGVGAVQGLGSSEEFVTIGRIRQVSFGSPKTLLSIELESGIQGFASAVVLQGEFKGRFNVDALVERFLKRFPPPLVAISSNLLSVKGSPVSKHRRRRIELNRFGLGLVSLSRGNPTGFDHILEHHRPAFEGSLGVTQGIISAG